MNTSIKLTMILGCILSTAAYAELSNELAEEQVKNANCKDLPIKTALKHKIKKHSQRDLGWRVFNHDTYIDVERAILVNKGKQIRYRWRIDQQGSVFPVSKKAKKLCLP